MEKNRDKQNGFMRFLKRVFVHNIGLKLLSLGLAAFILLLMIISN